LKVQLAPIKLKFVFTNREEIAKMKHIRLITLFTAIVVILVVAFGLSLGKATPGVAATAEIDPKLLSQIANEGSANFFVVIQEKADLSAAYSIKDWNARGQYVYDTLSEVANRSQEPVIAYANANGLDYRSFFTNNSVYIKNGDLTAVQELAEISGVEYLRLEGKANLMPDTTIAPLLGPTVDEVPESPASFGWNLDVLDPDNNYYGMQASQVWNQYGITGDGIVVANIDTGVYFEHEALVEQYRGNLGNGSFDHDFNWYMPTDAECDGSLEPCDWEGHGSGTMGIMAGETPDKAMQIGIAPGAEWISCLGCDQVDGCYDAALLGCADWMVAPCAIGDDPGDPSCDPTKRPNVINNSWGGPGGDSWYQSYIQAWVAAGMFPAFSAGNTNACNALGSPGDNPEAFGTAAHAGNGLNLYAGGPSIFFPNPSCDPDDHQIDPHINSPTFGLTAGNNPGEYYNLSGTSGASPHTAGAVALIWEANPTYVGDILGTFTVLEQSRIRCSLGDCGKPACN
jgi:subtilisin family serine protease